MKLSGKNGFWSNIRKTDKHLYKTSAKYQKNYRKLKKAELDFKFLYRYKDNEVYPKFTQWKHCKRLKPKVREKHHNTVLKDSVSDTHKKIKNLNKDLESNEKCLRESTTWMKFILIKCSVHRLVSKENKKTAERHDKKLICRKTN